MSPERFREIRKSLGMSQKDLARALNYGIDGDRMIRRIESGTAKPSGPVIRLLEFLQKEKSI
jgi:DNA-binding transcriptional regulator YiaG